MSDMSSQNITQTKAKVGITPLPDLVKLQCSCSSCDSNACCIKKQVHQQCSCNECLESKTCLFFSVGSKRTLDSFDDNELKTKYVKENKKVMTEYEQDRSTKLLKIDSRLSLNDESKEKLEEIVILNTSNLTHNFTDTNCRSKASQSRAKLSAQIMNVPYKDFEKSISVPARKPETLSNMTKMSLFDLFQKMKDLYKACSCRVCECIAGRSQINEFCNCKPCDCNDCKNSFNKQVVISRSDKELLYTSYLCPRSQKLSFRKLAKSKKQECNCTPCECIRCVDNMSEVCACKPCQCIQCKPDNIHKHQTLVVAAVGDDHRTRQVCQCSPCECAQCGHGGISMTHEMSTELNRHPQCHCDACNNEACLSDNNETCRCERQDKVMRKPVQRDSNDYDIRRAIITENLDQVDRNRLDMIAMFTYVSSRYEKNCSYKRECNCGQSECLFCKYKERSANAVKTSNIVLSNDHNINDVCVNFKSSVCNFHEGKYNTVSNLPPLKTTINTFNSPCNCNICDCIRCETLKENVISNSETKPINKFSSKGKCRCNPCECADCNKITAICTGDNSGYFDCKYGSNMAKEVLYPIKKGLTPEIYKEKMNRSLIKIDGEKIECKNDEYSFVQNERFQSLQINVSNQCNLNNRAFITTQTENRNECWTKRKSTYVGRFFYPPERFEKVHESVSKVSSVSSNTRKTAFVFLKNAFTLDEDYVRVQRTLEDARDFSQQLTKMLEKYDKANREFESLSQKLRIVKNTPLLSLLSNTSISSIKKAFLPESDIYNATENSSNDSIPTKDLDTNSASGDNLLSQESISDEVNPNFKQFSKQPIYNTYKDLLGEKFYDIIGSSHHENLIQLKHEPPKNYSLNRSDTDTSYSISLVDDSVHGETNLNSIAEENEQSSEHVSLPIKRILKKKKLKKYNKMYRRVHILSKRFVPKMVKCSITTETSNAFITEVKDNETGCNKLYSPNLHREFIKSSVENGAVKDINIPVIVSSRAKVRIIEPRLEKHNTSEDNNIVMIKPPVDTELVMHPVEMKPWPILKKNLSVKTEREAIVNGYCEKSLEVNLRKAERSISWQSEYPKAPVNNMRPDNKALVNLHSEVKKLLELPMFNKIETTSNDINNLANNKDLRSNPVPHTRNVFTNVSTSEVETEAYSCDAMKVCFLTARKISDHTVIVRWKAPRTLKNVQGYELLVDGQPMQKILNTSRCLAVVTCLPHFERILLTVRTVTILPCASGHNPSATIVYRPRSKVKI